MTNKLQASRQDLSSERTLIHFNNAGASLMPQQVVQCQIEHLQREAQIGGYEAANQARTNIDQIYSSVAELLNCSTAEIALVENATIAWMSAFYSIGLSAGDKILTAEAEYASNYLAYLQLRDQKGVQIEIIPSNAQGEVCLKKLEAMIDEKVKLISITHIPTNGGLVNPIEEIGVIAKKHDVLYLVDACQSAGQLPLDVDKIQCDMLSATSRKYLRGPRGAGFLYVRKSIIKQLHPAMIDLHGATLLSLDRYQLRADARRFENWENNYSALLGMGRAIDYALALGIENIAKHIMLLAQNLRLQLSHIPQVTLYDLGRIQCGITSFSVEGIDSEKLTSLFKEHQINVSCSKPSSTLIDADRRKLPNLLRASIHYFNTEDEVTRFISVLQQIIANERSYHE